MLEEWVADDVAFVEEFEEVAVVCVGAIVSGGGDSVVPSVCCTQ